MIQDHERLAAALLRSHLHLFVQKAFYSLHPGKEYEENWHVEAMCHALEQVTAGECRRLLITVPPRHLKSICTAVALPAWLLGRDPACKIMVASYGADLASKHAGDCRAIMETDWYRLLYPALRIERNTAQQLTTTRMGGRLAVSAGGAATGFGADFLIVDDLMKAADARLPSARQGVKEYYEQTLFSRLNDKQTGRIIAIQQRLHEDDLAAYLIDKGNFAHLDLPAIADEEARYPLPFGRTHRRRRGEVLFPQREPLTTLEEIRKDIGTFAFSAQYQQNPTPPEGNRVRWAWFGSFDEAPSRDELLTVVQSWDTAVTAEPTSDFSVCTTWGLRQDKKWLLLDVVRERLEYPALRSRARSLQERWQADAMVIEHAGTGVPLIQELRLAGHSEVWAHRPDADKETRLAAQCGKLEDGLVLLPVAAPWLAVFRQEVLAFPHGRYDDQVDSMAQFLDWTGSRFGRARVGQILNGGRPVRPQGRRR